MRIIVREDTLVVRFPFATFTRPTRVVKYTIIEDNIVASRGPFAHVYLWFVFRPEPSLSLSLCMCLKGRRKGCETREKERKEKKRKKNWLFIWLALRPGPRRRSKQVRFYIQHISNTRSMCRAWISLSGTCRRAVGNIIEVTMVEGVRTFNEYAISPCPNITKNHFGRREKKLKIKKIVYLE